MGEFLKDPAKYIADGVKSGLGEALKSAGIWTLNTLVDGSYYICLGVALIAIFLYISGKKDAGKWVGISFIVFFILQSIKVVLGR